MQKLQTIDSRKTHGMARTRIYRIWNSMKQRCSNEKDKKYIHYGGKGIKVFPLWEKFEPFYDWAIANGYDENAPRGKCTIDRIDNDGNYEPGNCRWITETAQNRNQGMRCTNTSGHKGISWDKDRRLWAAYITANSKAKNLGLYANIEDAIAARENAEIQYWGNER